MSALAAAQPRTDAGSPESYAADLYERHRKAIYGLCYKQLRRREDADDAVQITFLYALTSLRRGVVPELELPWLFTIARNVCSTRRRTNIRRGAYESPQDLEFVQDRIASPERSDVATTEDFSAALKEIPETQRQALLLREWRGLSYDEIGAELGLSQSATEALLFRARENAAQRLGERTGLRAALQGLPFLSFLRKLLQSAAAKTVAVGAGAAIAVVVSPAAQEARPGTAPQRVPAPVPSVPVSPPLAPVSARHVHRVSISAQRQQATRTVAPAAARARHAQTQAVAAQAARNDVSTPASQQPHEQVQSAQAQSPVENVVGTADDVVQSLGVPSVSLPEVDVQTPAITVPVTENQTVTVPSVHLP